LGVPRLILRASVILAHEVSSLKSFKRVSTELAIPLLRLLGEWGSNRGGRILTAFPSHSPIPSFLLLSIGGSLLHLGEALRSSLQHSAASNREVSQGAPTLLYKIAQIFLSASGRLLAHAFGSNAGVCAMYGDVTFSRLWMACVGVLVSVPTHALASRIKLCREVFSCLRALSLSPLPSLPTQGPFSHFHAHLRGPFHPALLDSPAILLSGVETPPDPFLSLTSSTPFPISLVSLMLLPCHDFTLLIRHLTWVLVASSGRGHGIIASAGAGLLGRLSVVSGGSSGDKSSTPIALPVAVGHRAILAALSTLEGILSMEAHARFLVGACCKAISGTVCNYSAVNLAMATALSHSPSSASPAVENARAVVSRIVGHLTWPTQPLGESDSFVVAANHLGPALGGAESKQYVGRLAFLPSASLMSPAAAANITLLMSAHAVYCNGVSGGVKSEGGVEVFSSSILFSGNGGSDKEPKSQGVFGVEFICALIFLSLRHPNVYQHALARVLLPALVCRPEVLQAAASQVTLIFPDDSRQIVKVYLERLGQFAADIEREGVTEDSKHSFARYFQKLSSTLHILLT